MVGPSDNTVLWITWLLFFAAIEGQSLASGNYHGTLTARIRAWASLADKGKWWRARRAVLLGFLAWLSAHLVLEPGRF